MSVTTLVKKFEPEKDWHSIAEKYARKNGGTAAYWLNIWEKNKNRAAGSGSIYHKKQEIIARNGYETDYGILHIPAEYLNKENKYDNYSFKKNLGELQEGVYPELLVWNEEYCVSGQIDVAIIKEGAIGKIVDIHDYKTNKKINKESGYYSNYYRKHIYEYMNYPLDNVQNCNYYHYALQLSTYMYFMECFGFIAGELKILHRPQLFENGKFVFDEEGVPVVDKENSSDLVIPYLKEEVIKMLEVKKSWVNKATITI